MRRIPLALALMLAGASVASSRGLSAQAPEKRFTRADSLRGSNTPQRAWWDAEFYDLHVRVDARDSTIAGYNALTYRVLAPNRAVAGELQVDLQEPLVVDSVRFGTAPIPWRRDGNAIFARTPLQQPVGAARTISVYYHGRPPAAKTPPWDGGFVWQRDSLGNRWTATAIEGMGASAWWPTKDFPADEPDSQRVAISLPDSLINVSNGRLRSVTRGADGWTTWEWFVTSPINSYGIAVNAGRYAHWSEVYQGEAGPLTLDFYPLVYHEAAARAQWAQVRPMLGCFEHWFGPFPWYDDGYKLVETPYLGMEHQSAVAYGNRFLNGYLGQDLSGTGNGLTWDYIIIHESAHEWWANSLTDRDAADMWIHEAFGTYAENLYTECQHGKAAGAAYVIGQRASIANDRPIVGPFGVNEEGSGDMYMKGANVLHTLRTIIDDDETWRSMLRGLQRTYRHQTVSGQQVRDYLAMRAGLDLTAFFTQYLETTMVPLFETRVTGASLEYRWNHVVPGFAMPMRVQVDGQPRTITPTTTWQLLEGSTATSTVVPLRDYYIERRADNKTGSGLR